MVLLLAPESPNTPARQKLPLRCRWATVINRTDAGRRSVVGKIMSAISSSGVFILFLNIVVAVFAVVGMQFFGGHFHWPDGTSSRINFDNFYQVHDTGQPLH